jgi:hypothetical protein
MTIIGTPTSSPPTKNRSSMEMIPTPRSSPPSSNRSSWATPTMHTSLSLSPIMEAASDHTSDAGSDDEAIGKLQDLIEHQAGHTRSDTRDTIDSIVTGYASFSSSPLQHSRTQALAQTSEGNMGKLPRTPKTPTRVPEHKRLSRSTGIADLRGEYEYSSSNRSSYVDYYEDSTWPGAEEQTPSTPPSSPPYIGDSSPTLSCPITFQNHAEDEEVACSYELDFLRRDSISSILSPDCFSSAPPSEYEEQESEPEPKSFDGVGVLLEILDRLQDELDDFIADYDTSLRAAKVSQYVTSQIPRSFAVQNSDQGVDEQGVAHSAMVVGRGAGRTNNEDASKEHDEGRTKTNKLVRARIDVTAVEDMLNSAEEHDSVELATQVAFGIMLGMVWLAG